MRLAILDDYANAARESADWSRLPQGVELTVFNDHIKDEVKLAERLAPFDIVLCMRERTAFPKAVLDRLPNLKLIASTGYHNPSIDMDAARANGVTVTGTPSGSASTPELVLALMLALARNLVPQAELMRRGGWEHGLGRTLNGATLAILGLGNLGTKVAKLGAGFGMDVIAWSQNLTPEKAAAGGARYVEKDEFFRQADFLTLHLKLSQRTRHIVGAPELALMKPDAYIVNTARALNIDNQALIEALRQDRLAGAALDVHEDEPMEPDHPYRQEPKLLITPHLGYVTRETMRNFYPEALEAITAFLEGRKPDLVLT